MSDTKQDEVTLPDRIFINPAVAARYTEDDKRIGDVEYVRASVAAPQGDAHAPLRAAVEIADAYRAAQDGWRKVPTYHEVRDVIAKHCAAAAPVAPVSGLCSRHGYVDPAHRCAVFDGVTSPAATFTVDGEQEMRCEKCGANGAKWRSGRLMCGWCAAVPAATPAAVTSEPWRDEGGHAWEIHQNVTCVECPHCCFVFAAEHTSQRLGADRWEGYDCPNCEGCPDAAVTSEVEQDAEVDYFDPVSLLEKAMRTTMEIPCDCPRTSGACDGECVGSQIWQLIHRARKLIRAATPPAATAAEIERRAEATFDNQMLIAIRQLTKARQFAAHTEETGEVCTPECEGCNDPVGQITRELRADTTPRGLAEPLWALVNKWRTERRLLGQRPLTTQDCQALIERITANLGLRISAAAWEIFEACELHATHIPESSTLYAPSPNEIETIILKHFPSVQPVATPSTPAVIKAAEEIQKRFLPDHRTATGASVAREQLAAVLSRYFGEAKQ